MTQAHKTPGALVEAHPDLLEGGALYEFYKHIPLKGKVFEVISVNIPGHTTVRDIDTGELFGLHSENFKTVDKETKRQSLIKQRKIHEKRN